jgi:hypothetical protein
LFVDVATEEDFGALFQDITPHVPRSPGKAVEPRIQDAPGGVMRDETTAAMFRGGCKRSVELEAMKTDSLSVNGDQAQETIRCVVQTVRVHVAGDEQDRARETVKTVQCLAIPWIGCDVSGDDEGVRRHEGHHFLYPCQSFPLTVDVGNGIDQHGSSFPRFSLLIS